MPLTDYDELWMLEILQRLTVDQRIAFAAACAERLFHSYTAFVTSLELADHSGSIRSILDRLWDDLVGDRMTESEVDQQFKLCFSLIPDQEQGIWEAERGVVDDTVSSVGYSISCRKSGDPHDAELAASQAYAAVDYYVYTRDDIDISRPDQRLRVLSHPLVQAELKRQRRDLSELLGNRISIDQLKNRAQKEGLTFLNTEETE